MKVKELLDKKRTKVTTVSPDTSVYDAVKLMSKKDTDALVVTKNGDIAGILTDADYDRKIILAGKKSKHTKVREIMTSKVVYTNPKQKLNKCLSTMTANNFSHLPVLKNDRLVGLLSIDDIKKYT